MKEESKKEHRELGIFQRKDGSYWARFVYIDSKGKRRQLERRAKNKSDARRIRKDLESRYLANENLIDGDKMIFQELAAIYKERKLQPAQYHGEGDNLRKVSGLRSWKSPQRFLNTLIYNFGSIKVKNITQSMIEDFAAIQLKKPVIKEKKVKKKDIIESIKVEKPRAIATVNRLLELLRAMLRFAYREGYIYKVPHVAISKADEVKRNRVLSFEEENNLLAECIDRREHLRAILICALDTAMRKSEILRLERRDIDMANGEIIVRAFNTKTFTQRIIPIMTPRLKAEFEKLLTPISASPNDLVFGIIDNVKRSFHSACKAAKIEGFRFHDCRHTAITRMVESGIYSQAEIMDISGHTQDATFRRYVNPTRQTKQAKAELFAIYLEQQKNEQIKALEPSELVN